MVLNLFHFSEDGKFFKELDNIKQKPGSPLKLTLFMYDKRYTDLIAIFSKFKSNSSIISNFTAIVEDTEKILYSCSFAAQDVKYHSIYLVVSKSKPVMILISNLDRENYKKILSFFYALYPFINRIFIRSFQILKILSKIEEKSKIDLLVKSYVAKRYFGKKISHICYERTDYKSVFQKAGEDKLWIDSLLVELRKETELVGSVRINRRGIFSYNSLPFSELYHLFLEEVISFFIQHYFDYISGKSRSVDKLDPLPLKVTLADDVFIDERSFLLLIERLKKHLKNWGYSILSFDGQFGHLMLHDYSSGSCFDIYICSSRELFIIPQTQVTEISFNTILSIVLDNYEGEIENVR